MAFYLWVVFRFACRIRSTIDDLGFGWTLLRLPVLALPTGTRD